MGVALLLTIVRKLLQNVVLFFDLEHTTNNIADMFRDLLYHIVYFVALNASDSSLQQLYLTIKVFCICYSKE